MVDVDQLPLEIQAKLLGLLATAELERDLVLAKPRVIAATKRDLDTAVREGRFNSNLYLLLSVLCISMDLISASSKAAANR